MEFHSRPERRIVQENIEWCDIWLPDLSRSDLPRILLVGDSITRAYYPVVEKQLHEVATVGRLATSRCIGDEVLLWELETVLRRNSFQIIHFNNGMHGWGFSEEEYGTYFPELVGHLQQLGAGARLVWAHTTPVRMPNDVYTPHPRTERVRERNAIAARHLEPLQIPCNDLFSLLDANSQYFSSDGVHLNAEGNEAAGQQVAAILRGQLATL